MALGVQRSKGMTPNPSALDIALTIHDSKALCARSKDVSERARLARESSKRITERYNELMRKCAALEVDPALRGKASIRE